MNKKYVLKRIGIAGLIMYLVISLTFVLIQLLPGATEDYLAAQMVMDGSVDMDAVDVGTYLEGSIMEQYFQYMEGILTGNLGISDWFGEPVATLIADGLPWTVFVMSFAVFFVYAIGISLGALMAYKEGSRFDVVSSTSAIFLNSIPYYIAAIIMLYVLAFTLNWFPSGGRVDPYADPGFNLQFIGSAFYHAALPIASFALTAFGFRALQMRGNSISILGSNYVRVADLRGLPERYIALRYVAPNAVLPMYTGMMIFLGIVFGGSVVLEEIFSYTGIGWLLYQGLITRDIPLMMGTFMIISFAVVIGLTIADLTYGYINPRAAADDNNNGSDGISLMEIYLKLIIWKNAFKNRLSGNTTSDWEKDIQTDLVSKTDSTFNVTSDTKLSKKERYRRAFDEYVLAPIRLILTDWRAVIGLSVILLYILAGTIGVRIIPEPVPNQGPQYVPAFTMLEHPLGTDNTGQDMISSTVHATPAILKMIASGALIGAALATIVGLMAGYFGGIIERVLTGIADVVLAIPGLPLVMVLAVVIEPESPYVVGLLLVVNAWAGTARQVHSETLALRAESYIEASQAMLVPKATILFKEILPNIAPFVFIKVVQMGRGVIFSAVALYFLGILPFTSSTYNWGVTMNQAYNYGALYTTEAIHWLLIPMIAIIGLCYAMVLFAQGCDQMFNPQVRVRHAKTQIEEDEGPPSGATPADD